MASYASVLSTPGPAPVSAEDLQAQLQADMDVLRQVKIAPPTLTALLSTLRREMESTDAGPKMRNFGGASAPSNTGRSWRSGVTNTDSQKSFGSRNTIHRNTSTDSFASSHSGSRTPLTPNSTASPRAPVGRYQSKFTSGSTNLQDKILNTVIGNKLNSFTALTYTDIRDFIYQILDSGETEFIKDFVEKVFKKATLEELYCALFAKLIAEIGQRYPVMVAEMNKRHEAFLDIFDDVQEGGGDGNLQARAYRLGYGQFLSELAGQNALEKSQLIAMVEKVIDRIWTLSSTPDKSKAVEEFADCLVRLTQSLKEKTPAYFRQVQPDLKAKIQEKSNAIVQKGEPRPSLSSKARFALMDLLDLIA